MKFNIEKEEKDTLIDESIFFEKIYIIEYYGIIKNKKYAIMNI